MIKTTIKSALDRFERGELGSLRVRPEHGGDWLPRLIHELHEDQLPSNWRYETARSLLIALGDLCARQDDEGDIRAAIDEELWEICEGLVDAYNGARWEWFTEDGWVYAEDVVEAIRAGDSDFTTALGDAQFNIIVRMAEAIVAKLEEVSNV